MQKCCIRKPGVSGQMYITRLMDEGCLKNVVDKTHHLCYAFYVILGHMGFQGEVAGVKLA